MLVLVLGLGGMATLYFIFKNKQATQMYGPNQKLGNKPANTVGSARQDNANQPWYKGPVVQSIATQVKKNPTQALKDVGSVVHSLSSIWGDVSDYFKSDETTTNVDENFGAMEDTSDYDLPDWGGSQSDLMTAEFDASEDYSFTDDFDMNWDNLDDGTPDYGSVEDWSVA